MASKETSTEVVPASEVSIVQRDPLVPAAVEKYERRIFELSVDDPAQIINQMLDRILQASSAEEILGQPEVEHAAEMIHKPFKMTGVRWLRSAFTDGPAVYAIIDGVLLEDGEQVAITCGASNVMAMAYRLDELGMIPCDVVIRRSEKATTGGFYPMWLEPAPADGF